MERILSFSLEKQTQKHVTYSGTIGNNGFKIRYPLDEMGDMDYNKPYIIKNDTGYAPESICEAIEKVHKFLV